MVFSVLYPPSFISTPDFTYVDFIYKYQILDRNICNNIWITLPFQYFSYSTKTSQTNNMYHSVLTTVSLITVKCYKYSIESGT